MIKVPACVVKAQQAGLYAHPSTAAQGDSQLMGHVEPGEHEGKGLYAHPSIPG
jgi:hypothetical protein